MMVSANNEGNSKGFFASVTGFFGNMFSMNTRREDQRNIVNEHRLMKYANEFPGIRTIVAASIALRKKFTKIPGAYSNSFEIDRKTYDEMSALISLIQRQLQLAHLTSDARKDLKHEERYYLNMIAKAKVVKSKKSATSRRRRRRPSFRDDLAAK